MMLLFMSSLMSLHCGAIVVYSRDVVEIQFPGWDSDVDFLKSDLYTKIALHYKEEYSNKFPFPHFQIDGLFPMSLTNRSSEEFPRHAVHLNDQVSPGWHDKFLVGDEFQNGKLSLRDEDFMGPATMV
jgi:hypothetical protein